MAQVAARDGALPLERLGRLAACLRLIGVRLGLDRPQPHDPLRLSTLH